MVDVDFAPGVFMGIIACVVAFPAIYGLLFVDAFWKKHQEEGGNDDVFN